MSRPIKLTWIWTESVCEFVVRDSLRFEGVCAAHLVHKFCVL